MIITKAGEVNKVDGVVNHEYKKKMLIFSIPLVLSLFTQQFYNIVDMMVVGQFLGVNELSAVGNAGSIVMVFIVLSGGLEIACDIIVSRCIGKKEYNNLSKLCMNMLILGVIGALMLSSIGILSLNGIIHIMNIPLKIMQDVKMYCYIYMAGALFIYCYDISRAFITTLGYSHMSFYLVVTSSIINIILDILFVCVFHMDVGGVALATILAQMICMCISIKLCFVKIKEYSSKQLQLTIDFSILLEVLKVAIPSAFQQSVITLTYTCLQSWVNPYGVEIMSGYVEITKIINITQVPLIALSQTSSIYFSRLFVNTEMNKIKSIYKFLLKVSLVYILVIGIVFMFFNKGICYLFFDVDKYNYGYQFFRLYICLYSIVMIFNSMKYLNESMLRSFLHMKLFLLSSFIDVVVRLVCVYCLNLVIGLPAFVIGEGIARLCSVLFSIRQLKRIMKVPSL